MNKKIKNVVESFLKGILGCIVNIACKLYDNFPHFIMNIICDVLEKKTGDYWSYRARPLQNAKMVVASLYSPDIRKTAIILQGPIRSINSFTVETVKYYHRIMPRVMIIISTWEGSDRNVIDCLKKHGAHVILSKVPEYTGNGNMNYQVVSSLAGIEEAKKCGKQYVLKTRTDQRLCNPDFLNYCFSLLKVFPVGDKFAYLNQKQRIIVGQGSGYGSMFVPFFISDFFYFGETEAILRMFSLNLQKINQTTEERSETRQTDKKGRTIAEYYAHRAPEISIMLNYISDGGKMKIDRNIHTYWEFVKENLITVSHNEVQLLWPKYKKNHDENKIDFSYADGDTENLLLSYTWTFSRWLNLYTGEIKYSEEFERISNLPAEMI